MTRIRLALALSLASLLGAALPAQQVPITGRVEALPGGGPCGLGSTHEFPVAGVLLEQTNNNLAAWEGQVVTVWGRQVGTPQCPVLQVQRVQAANAELDWFGHPIEGGPVYFEIVSRPLGGPYDFTVYVSRQPALQPYGPLLGTILISAPYSPVCAGSVTSFSICAELIPYGAGLSGTTVYAQYLLRHAYAELSNVVAIPIA